VTRGKLKEVFALAGKVVYAELKEDKNGKSRGLGTVEFETPLEAVQAVCILCSMVWFCVWLKISP
jgi:heterogeneous nuclear ribonucleoprotein M